LLKKNNKVFCKTRTKKSADGAEEHWIFRYHLGALQRQTPEKSRRWFDWQVKDGSIKNAYSIRQVSLIKNRPRYGTVLYFICLQKYDSMAAGYASMLHATLPHKQTINRGKKYQVQLHFSSTVQRQEI
jgi:hypothetical protein